MFNLNATAVLILSTVIASGAFAAGQSDTLSQGKTREQVHAEVLAARAAGTLDRNEVNYPPEVTSDKTLTREEVKAEVIRARRAGELDVNEATPAFDFVSHGK